MNKTINIYRIKVIAVAYISLLALAGILSLGDTNMAKVLFCVYLLPAFLPLILASWISNLIFGPKWLKFQTKKASIYAGMKDFGLVSLITGSLVGGILTAGFGFPDLVSVAFGSSIGLIGGLFVALPVGFSFGGYFGCRAFELRS